MHAGIRAATLALTAGVLFSSHALAEGIDCKVNGPLVLGGQVGEFLIGPNGRWVVYVADEDENNVFELYGAPIDGSQPSRKLSGPMIPGGDVYRWLNRPWFEFSPDGKWIVYRADQERDDFLELFSAPVTTHGPSRKLHDALTSPFAPYHHFEITRDGSHVIYVGNHVVPSGGNLHVVPIDRSAPPRTLGSVGVSFNGVPFRASPDGRFVFYLADEGTPGVIELFRRPIEGGGSTRISGPVIPAGAVRQFAFTPDGARVIYIADQETDEVFELYSAPADGSAAPVKVSGSMATGGDVSLTGDAGNPLSGFQVSPDGLHVIYRADQSRDDVYELFCAPVDGSAPAWKLNGMLAPLGDVYEEFAISPDGTRVVYCASEVTADALFSVGIDGTMRTTLDEPGQELAITAGGDRVVYRRSVIRSVPLDGSTAPVALSPVADPGSWCLHPVVHCPFAVTPDGRHLVFDSTHQTPGQRELFSVPVTGGSPVRINGGGVGDVLDWALSPDGDRVVYRGERKTDTNELYLAEPIDPTTAPGTVLCSSNQLPNLCPCGNDAALGRCGGCRHAAGTEVYLLTRGSTSIAADDLEITARGVPIGNAGIFVASQGGGAPTALFDGVRCVEGNVLRFRGKLAETSVVVETDFVAQDAFGAFWIPGQTYRFQYFTRDNQHGPSPCGGAANLSSAVAITMSP